MRTEGVSSRLLPTTSLEKLSATSKSCSRLHPTLEVTERGTGPVVGTVYVKVKFPRGN